MVLNSNLENIFLTNGFQNPKMNTPLVVYGETHIQQVPSDSNSYTKTNCPREG